MSKAFLPSSVINYKSQNKDSFQEPTTAEPSQNIGGNIFDDLSRMKDFHQARKLKNSLKARYSQEDHSTQPEERAPYTGSLKTIESPQLQKTCSDKQSQIKQLSKYERFVKESNIKNSKIRPIDKYLSPSGKSKVSELVPKKISSFQPYESNKAERTRMVSPNTKDKMPQNKNNYLNSLRHSEPNNEEDQNIISGSKYLQLQKLGEYSKTLKQLKETVSTSSSKKSVRSLKITDFNLGRDLGKGKFGQVRVAQHKRTGLVFSIKVINKLMVKQDNIIGQLIKQTKIQSFLNHSHIVKLYSVFDDDENVYLLMELCCEGNLYQYMQRKKRIPEKQASQFMKETCGAVRELHFNRIIHRDIKPQNIVLCFGMLKICDFGWSTEIRETLRQTFCGSPLYISPQLLKGQLYDEKVDLWALGILGYEMMTGTIPFQIMTERDLAKIINSRIVYPNSMSPLAISFLQQLLEKNPENRSSVEQLMMHPFINPKLES